MAGGVSNPGFGGSNGDVTQLGANTFSNSHPITITNNSAFIDFTRGGLNTTGYMMRARTNETGHGDAWILYNSSLNPNTPAGGTSYDSALIFGHNPADAGSNYVSTDNSFYYKHEANWWPPGGVGAGGPWDEAYFEGVGSDGWQTGRPFGFTMMWGSHRIEENHAVHSILISSPADTVGGKGPGYVYGTIAVQSNTLMQFGLNDGMRISFVGATPTDWLMDNGAPIARRDSDGVIDLARGGAGIRVSGDNSPSNTVTISLGNAANGDNGIRYLGNAFGGPKWQFGIYGTYVDMVGTSTTQTLTNKTINGANNTLTVRAGSDITGTLAVANGGTGTSSPGIVAGTNITVSGTWPNQTVNASGGGAVTTYPTLPKGTSATYYDENGNDITGNVGIVPAFCRYQAANASNFAGRAHHVPFFASAALAITKVKYYVSANNNANGGKIAFYTANATTGLPQTRVGQVETISVASTGWTTATLAVTHNISAGTWFWVAIATSSTTNFTTVDCEVATNILTGIDPVTSGTGSAHGGNGLVDLTNSYASAFPSTQIVSSDLRISGNDSTGQYYGNYAPLLVLQQ